MSREFVARLNVEEINGPPITTVGPSESVMEWNNQAAGPGAFVGRVGTSSACPKRTS